MRTKIKLLIVAGMAAVVAGSAATVSGALAGDDSSLTGTELERASRSALDHTGGLRVVESEAGEGGAAYEVAVLLDDGSVVEVQLDADFQVSGSDTDDEGPAEPAESGEPGEGGADDGP
ncbi:MAG TPA: hypothetical protein VNC60_05475 [Actinomycetota bacterium]|nr:hypothetical protein [Actinomycetota bacterium]